MKLLIIPSWYPTKLHQESGSFFRDRAHILKNNGFDVMIAAPIVHSFKDIFSYTSTMDLDFFLDDDLPTYLNETINIFPKSEKLHFYRYKKNAVSLLQKIVNKHGVPDIIYFNSVIWAAAALSEYCNKLNIPYIISEHLKEFLIVDGFSKFQKKLIRKTYGSCSGIIATSSALKKAISNSFPEYKSNIFIIPNPINEDIFIKKSILKKQSSFNIICVALFRSEKRIDLVVESFYELLQSGEKAKLTIVGDGPLKSILIDQIQKLNLSDSIELKGYLSQQCMVKELHNNDFLVLGSEIETFGVVLIEAQACGLPVVATDCGGPSDIILTETGILVKPGSSKELTRGLKKMMYRLNNYNPDIIRSKTIQRFGKFVYTNAIRKFINRIIEKST